MFHPRERCCFPPRAVPPRSRMSHALLALESAVRAFPSEKLIPPSISAFTFTACTSYFRFILWHFFLPKPWISVLFPLTSGVGGYILQHNTYFSCPNNFTPLLFSSLIYARRCYHFLACSFHCVYFKSNGFVPKVLSKPRTNLLALLFFLPSPFAMCQLLLGVGGKVQMLLGAFSCILKQDLSFQHVWNNVCNAKPRLAWELALISSESPPSRCRSSLFLLVLGQFFRNSLFPLFRDSSPTPSPFS